MTTETVTYAGSGLVFVNNYDSSVTASYHSAIITAENFYQSHFSNAVTINQSFSVTSGSGFVAENSFYYQTVSFNTLKNALAGHATTADDLASVGTLNGFTDPTGGAGFAITNVQAKALLRPSSPFFGNNYPFRFLTPETATQSLSRAGLAVLGIEATGRSYRGVDEYFEWLSVTAQKQPVGVA